MAIIQFSEVPDVNLALVFFCVDGKVRKWRINGNRQLVSLCNYCEKKFGYNYVNVYNRVNRLYIGRINKN